MNKEDKAKVLLKVSLQKKFVLYFTVQDILNCYYLVSEKGIEKLKYDRCH